MAEPSQARVQRTPQLTCELCRDRKVKCDKLEPCSSCLLAGVQCVSIHRPRLPRGRHAQRLSRALPSSVSSLTNASGRGNIAPGETNDELKERVRKLESLVQSLDSARTAIASSSIGSPSSKKEGLDDFWEDLVQEVSICSVNFMSCQLGNQMRHRATKLHTIY